MGETALVAVQLPNSQLVRELEKAWDRGEAVLPLDPKLPQPAVSMLVEELRPSALVDPSGCRPLPRSEPVADDVSLVVMTSGTSGRPKGVELSTRAMASAAEAVTTVLSSGRRWLCCLPLSRIAGLAILFRSQILGTKPVIHDKFDPTAIGREQDVDLISLVPAALARLLDARVDLSGYAAVLLGGGPIPPELLAKAKESGVRVVTTYGMTETCGGCVHDGIPLPAVSVAVEDERILIRGPILMNGYRLQPELTREHLADGWFRTSDRGRLDEDGRLAVYGRLDDVITTGGVKVSPVEVEEVLSRHPRVADAAVAGVPDEKWGQAVGALVVTVGNGAEEGRVSADALKEFVTAEAGSFHAPKVVRFVDRIPRNWAGKIVRQDVIAELLDDPEGKPGRRRGSPSRDATGQP
ncbi:MAG: AMP-binding protein [Actinomycetota bacterium]|nr:AMP-binding protein [Actinomycetota bacterium]